MNDKLNLLILGSGMFVTGRGTSTYGTVLPSIFEIYKKNKLSNVIICSTSYESSIKAKKKIQQLSKIYNINFKIFLFPNKKNSNYSLINIVKKYEINCSIISIPDHLHTKYTIQLMKRNIHCLVVKPMTNNKKDALKMIKICNDNNLLGMVEFHKRYDQANIILRDKILNNEIGKLQYAIIEYSQRKSIPTKFFSKWVNKTNIFQYLGIHYVDLIFYLTNFMPIKVNAFGQMDYLKKNKINTYDSIQVIIEWKRNDSKKFISLHTCNWIDPNKTSAMSDQKIKIIGDWGRLVSDQKNRGLTSITDDYGIDEINPYFTTILKNNNIDTQSFGYGIKSITNFLNLCEYFINNKNIKIRNYLSKNNTLPTFETSYISTLILEAVNSSLKKNKPISIKL